MFHSLLLSLFPVPLPNVIISPGSVNVTYNSTVTLTCIVQSLTTPTVIWTNDTNVNLTSLVSINDNKIHNSTLILEQVTLKYIGEYTCTAENVGGGMSDMINVIVYGKDMCAFIHPSFLLFVLIHFCKLD